MNVNKILKQNSDVLLRKYLWNHDRNEWFQIVLHNFLSRFRIFVFLFLFFCPLTVARTLADGTNNQQYLLQNVKMMAQTLPAMEKAFADIDSLRRSISKVSYQDPDKAFIFAYMITKWALINHLDPLEVAAVMKTESNFVPTAVSNKDARGLMQIHRPTWKMDNYFDAEENIKKGAEILIMYKRGFPQSYLTRYSGGEDGYERKVEINKAKIKKEIKKG